eukprot:m.137875 g.137875  ORF g.137875 m.137875 type:complete len:1048 (-) comp14911_c3_seq3:28-3171(-)
MNVWVLLILGSLCLATAQGDGGPSGSKPSSSRSPDPPPPPTPVVSVSYTDLAPLCSNCVPDQNDLTAIKPGPCFFPLNNGNQRCFPRLVNGSCPTGTSPCSTTQHFHLVDANTPLHTVRVPWNQGNFEVSTGTAVVFVPTDGNQHVICSGSPNSRTFNRGDGKFFSGVLSASDYFWLPQNSAGRFNFYDSKTGAQSCIVVRPPSEKRPPPVRVYIPVRYGRLSKNDLDGMSNTIKQEIQDLLNMSAVGTAVFNVSLLPSEGGFVAVDVQLDTSSESQLILNSTNAIYVDLGGGTYVATTSDPVTNDAENPIGSSPSILGPVLGACLGAALVALIIGVVVYKRRHSESDPHDVQTKAIRLENFDLDEMAMNPTMPLLDSEGFAEIHTAVITGNHARVLELLQRDAGSTTRRDGPVEGAVVSPFAATHSDVSPLPVSMPSPGSAPSVSPVPTSTAASTPGIRLVDLPDARGNTPLVWAVRLGDLAMCQTLINANASVAASNADGHTPLLLACIEGADLPLLQALLAAGSDVDARDNNGVTSLAYASTHGRADLASALLGAGCDPNIADHRGMTPLMLAVFHGHSDMVRLLLSAPSLQANAKDAQGLTSLHWAAAVGERDCLRWLLAHRRVRAAVINNKGETPLHLAAREGNMEVIETLAETRRAELVRVLIPALNVDGLTAMDYAGQNHHSECVALMHRLAMEGPLASTDSPAEITIDFDHPLLYEPVVAPLQSLAPAPPPPRPFFTVHAPLTHATSAQRQPAPARAVTLTAAATATVPTISESDSGVDEFAAAEGTGVLDHLSPDGPAPSAGDGSPPSPPSAIATAAAAADAEDEDGEGDGECDDDDTGGSRLPPEERAANRREQKKQYMRARRRELKAQELQWEDRVAELNETNRSLAAELAASRAEALRLRQLMSARAVGPGPAAYTPAPGPARAQAYSAVGVTGHQGQYMPPSGSQPAYSQASYGAHASLNEPSSFARPPFAPQSFNESNFTQLDLDELSSSTAWRDSAGYPHAHSQAPPRQLSVSERGPLGPAPLYGAMLDSYA